MKLRICCLLALALMLAMSASASLMVDEEYTDVTSVMTQDAVLELEWFSEEPEEELSINLQQPDKQSMQLLEDIYDFVWREGNRPVRYYDEETQQKIQALVPGVDIDALYLTEFMAQDMHGVPREDEDVVVERLLDVEYQPGQLVVVVLGYEDPVDEDGVGEYRWFPYRGHVPELGLIRYTIPKEDYDILTQQEQVIYHVLTIRVGARGDVLVHYEASMDRNEVPSKRAENLITINKWYSSTGAVIEDNFSIFVVDKTKEMNREIERIGRYLAEELPDGEHNKIINWFPPELVNQAQLLIGEEVDRETLIGYDIVAVMSKEYKDTYGDVSTESNFAPAYSSEKKMVSMLGFPLEEDELPDLPPEELEKVTHFEWYCLRTEAHDTSEVSDMVEILYKQLVIPWMEEEPALLIVLSEPLEEPLD